jgi:hypothetical protein
MEAKNHPAIGIVPYKKVGNLKEGWGYQVIFPFNEKIKVDPFFAWGTRVKEFDGHLIIEDYQGSISSNLRGIESLKNIGQADKRAYDIAREEIATRMYAEKIRKDSKVKIIDATERGKVNQLEIESMKI